MTGDTTYDPTSAIKVFYSQVSRPEGLPSRISSPVTNPAVSNTSSEYQARQEIATGNYIVPLTTAMLQSTTTGYATASAQRYFAQINSNGQPNSTALQLIATAPQTISPGVSWTMVNLRPYTYVVLVLVIFAVRQDIDEALHSAPAAQAATLVGNIFLCIFS